MLLILCWFTLSGQIKTQDDLILEADRCFINEQYDEALQLYSRLLSVNPENPFYNYRYGVSSLHADRSDHQRTQKYLEFAHTAGYSDKELAFHLGLAYFFNMKFESAIRSFNAYLSQTSPDPDKQSEIQRLIRSSENGLSLLKNNFVETISETQVSDRDNFYRIYPNQNLDGKVLLKPEVFQSNYDKKMDEVGLIVMPSQMKVLYYSSYGDDVRDENEGNKDIYVSRLQEDEEWSIPEKLPEIINTPYDEDYPVLAENGTVLYFSSKGHNSMGGYDIFVSRYDTVQNSWSTPVNLDFPINTPFDDILLVPEKETGYVWFASARNTTGSFIRVYKARLSRDIISPDIALTRETRPSLIPDISEDIEKAAQGDEEDIQEKITDTPKEYRKGSHLVDSAFLMVNDEKARLREIKTVKDRAFIISGSKNKQAAELEAEKTALSPDNPEHIEKLNQLLIQQATMSMRAVHAANIGEVIKKQISFKELLIENLRKQASLIQETYATGTYEQTMLLFDIFKQSVKEADTLSNYHSVLDAIKNDITDYPLDIALLSGISIPEQQKTEISQRQEVVIKDKDKVTEQTPSASKNDQDISYEALRIAMIRKEADSCSDVLREIADYWYACANASGIVANRFGNKYWNLLADSPVLEQLSDSLLRRSLADTLTVVARKAVLAYHSYRVADSLKRSLDHAFYLKDQILSALAQNNLGMASSMLEELTTSTLEASIIGSPLHLVANQLPIPKETHLNQSQRLLQVAQQHLDQFEELIEQADKYRAKATKKKAGKKQRELLREAEKTEKKANQKFQNYLTNYEKGSYLAANYRASSINRQFYPEVSDQIASEVNSPTTLQKPVDLSLAEEFYHCGFIWMDCPEIIAGDISDAVSVSVAITEDVPVTKPARFFVFNHYGYTSKARLLEKLKSIVGIEKGLIEKKSQRSDNIKYAARREQFVVFLENDLTRRLSEIKVEQDDASAGDHALIVASGIISNPDNWKDYLLQYGLANELDTSKAYVLELQDSKSIVNLMSFLERYIRVEQLSTGLPENEDFTLAASYVDEAEFLLLKSIENRKKAGLEQDMATVRYLLDDINTFELAACEQLGMAFSVYKSLQPSASGILAVLDENIMVDALLASEPGSAPTTPEKKEETPPVIPEIASTAKELLFRIQLIALGRPVEDDYFKGIQPIYREPVKNSVMIRYLGGEFTTPESAEAGRKEFASKGFPGAFVVSYYKGDRIGMEEAISLLSESSSAEAPVLPVQKDERPPHEEIAEQDVPIEPEPEIVAKKTPVQKELEKPVDEIKKVEEPEKTYAEKQQEVIFAVQIGAFSETKSPQWVVEKEKQAGASISYIRSETGSFIYMAGAFTDLEAARQKKDLMNTNALFADAFVVAVFNGRKIPVAEAVRLLEQ